jgi:Zn-dependent peptidase ImmA (M78 family)/transcriptional regulator with XRE-family HTH domain
LALEPSLRGSRFITLRHLDGLTQTDLASELGVTQSFLSQVEKGTKPLPADLARAAADRYDLPVEFFTVQMDPTEAGVATFRKSSKASVRDENLVMATYGEAARLFRIASEGSGYQEADIHGAITEDVEEAAGNVRSMLGLGPTDPMANATRAAERLGVGVINGLVPIERHSGMHDGISRPNAITNRPLIATVGEQPPAVARMTLMHELGHLLYDRDRTVPIRGTRSPEERRAFRFGGAMLIPASVVRTRITESLTLHGYLRVKADYGISVSALIVRACDLGVISAQRKRSLFIQLSSQGWRRAEPVPVAAEKPLLIKQATERGIATDARAVAHATGIRYRLIEQWTGMPTQQEVADVVPLRRP